MGKKMKENNRRIKERTPLEKVDDLTWLIPQYKKGMKVPGMVFANKNLLEKMKQDRTLSQCVNVAHLPGIYKYAITLPDGHEGYGFPIGGVAATDYDEGVISPGGVGYDINCGVRLLTTQLSEQTVRSKLDELVNVMFRKVPCGLGSSQKTLRIRENDWENFVMNGVQWAIDQGYGWAEDVNHCEEQGCMEKANPDKISNIAKKRGSKQAGTLGSGNHFLEIQKVDSIYNTKVAKNFGIESKGQITIMIHCGSRGFGHQICSDYLRVMEKAARKYNIVLPDRELACAPGKSREAEDYYQAMACAVNYAFVNRQIITHAVRQSFKEVYKKDPEKLGLNLVYDVAHNIAKIESHQVNDQMKKKVYVHRKGATRAFPPNHPEIPSDFRTVGQPVFLPGSMGTSSWVLVGTEKAMEKTFGSTAHGAGRKLSRSAAKRQVWGGDVKKKLGQRGIIVRSASPSVLAEEADIAYKNVDIVAEVSHKIGIATKVARLVPLAVIKG